MLRGSTLPQRCALLLALLLSGGCSALGHVPEPLPTVRGPLPIRSNHPLNLTFLAFRPRTTRVVPAGQNAFAAQVAYASIHEIDSRPGALVAFDGELGRFTTRWQRGLGDGFELEVEVPLAWTGAGFLDGFVESFHDFFGLANQGREFVPQDDFDMRLVKGGVTLYEREEDDFGVGDIPIVLTRELRTEAEHGLGLAVRAGIELPTGSRASGAGNGELDVGVGILGEHSAGRWTTTWAMDIVVTGRPSTFAGSGADAADTFDLQGGLEYRWSDAVSLVAEFITTTPIVDEIELEEIDSPILELGVGFAVDGPSNSVWYIAFQEDVLAAAGADFALFAGWRSGVPRGTSPL